MSEQSRRYWLIDSGEAMEVKARLFQIQKKCDDMVEVLRQSIKFKGYIRCWHSGRVCGFQFSDGPPDSTRWKKSTRYPGYYLPKRNTKIGKQIDKALDDIQYHTYDDIGLMFLGKPYILADNFYTYYAQIDRIGSKHVVVANDVYESVAEGSDETGQTWEPVEGLREIKASEYHAMKEAEDNTDNTEGAAA